MKTSDFDYALPPELIASEPLPQRDTSRMMVLERATRKIHHAKFLDLTQWLRAGDLLVLNDTKVMPARLSAIRERTDERGNVSRSHVEILLLEERTPAVWEALVRPGQKVHLRDKIIFGDGKFVAIVEDRTDFGGRVLRFTDAIAPLALMEKHGAPPLPSYILRARQTEQSPEHDKEIYQTVFARKLGAAAAPTAGLHFTEATFQKLEEVGVGIAYVTLHVGLGTFRPVKAENLEEHVMHHERFTIPAETLRAIAETKARDGRVIAVGTTVVRTLESLSMETWKCGAVVSGATDIFIYPPYEFKVVDALLTNFHLPKSTLLMLVCAFASPAKKGTRICTAHVCRGGEGEISVLQLRRLYAGDVKVNCPCIIRVQDASRPLFVRQSVLRVSRHPTSISKTLRKRWLIASQERPIRTNRQKNMMPPQIAED